MLHACKHESVQAATLKPARHACKLMHNPDWNDGAFQRDFILASASKDCLDWSGLRKPRTYVRGFFDPPLALPILGFCSSQLRHSKELRLDQLIDPFDSCRRRLEGAQKRLQTSDRLTQNPKGLRRWKLCSPPCIRTAGIALAQSGEVIHSIEQFASIGFQTPQEFLHLVSAPFGTLMRPHHSSVRRVASGAVTGLNHVGRSARSFRRSCGDKRSREAWIAAR